MEHYNEKKSIVKDLYEHFKHSMPYSEAIEKAINTVLYKTYNYANVVHPSLRFNSLEQLKNCILEEIQYEVNINQEIVAGEYYILEGDDTHIPWYRDKVSKGLIHFKFWERYKKYLLNIKGWSSETVSDIDKVTENIIDLIEDPMILNRSFYRKGLVVGYVQSGKTAHYTGLINKAMDCGYRVIIVLSGLHNNLRSQTQIRLDKEVVGRNTSESTNNKIIGVCTLPGEKFMGIDTFTTQGDKGDFSKRFARQMGGIQPARDRPMIFVIKKNASVLKNLIKYFKESTDLLGDGYITVKDNKKIIKNLPLLLIDDEADQATPNTKPYARDDKEIDPTAINANVRELLNLFYQKAYVGFTATPYANIFIHHKTDHTHYFQDLFPSSFILTIDPPSNYFGPVKVFGLKNDEDDLPIYRPVLDASHLQSEFLPLKHRMTDIPDHIPVSMKNAIKSFILSSAIRRFRGQEMKHNTMLIHCTRYTDIQNTIAQLVEDEFTKVRDEIINNDSDTLRNLRDIYEDDFSKTSSNMNHSVDEWVVIEPYLKPAVLKIEREPRIINGSAGDILDYDNHSGTGLSVIVVGGDKLSRGLTLEGLTVSYFTRASTLYDTLMQMGRWFGYKPDYEDLCRLYTTPYLFRWFRHISIAYETLKNEFVEMSRQRSTPKDFGLRVLSHPDLMATNAMKMRYTQKLPLTYKGTLTETSTLSGNGSILKNNLDTTVDFISKLKELPVKIKKNNGYLWKDVNKELVIDFFKNYRSHKQAVKSSTGRINEFIENQKNMVSDNHLLDYWNVFLATKKSNDGDCELAGIKVVKLRRSIKEPFENDRLFIQRLVGSVDEKIDFEHSTGETARILRSLPPRLTRPLLILYPLIITEIDEKTVIDLKTVPIGFAISWPNNEELIETSYDINTVYQELELEEYD